MIYLRSLSRRRVTLSKRDVYGLNALHRTELRGIYQMIEEVANLIKIARRDVRFTRTRKFLKRLLVLEYMRLIQILFVDVPEPQRIIHL